MATSNPTPNATDADPRTPDGYEQTRDGLNSTQWQHTGTGIVVELSRIAQPTQMHTPETARIDHHKYSLIIRSGGPGTEGTRVDECTDPDHARDRMAYDWMQAHPDGGVDL